MSGSLEGVICAGLLGILVVSSKIVESKVHREEDVSKVVSNKEEERTIVSCGCGVRL